MNTQALLRSGLFSLLGLGFLSLGAPGAALAQQLELPRPSPLAKVSQAVGLTDVSVEYSSPAIKGLREYEGGKGGAIAGLRKVRPGDACVHPGLPDTHAPARDARPRRGGERRRGRQ